MKGVVSVLLSKYKDKRIVIFADNDRHLEKNESVLKAQEAKKLDSDRIGLVAPDFGDCRPSKEASDWNDLVRLVGIEKTRLQLMEYLRCFIDKQGDRARA